MNQKIERCPSCGASSQIMIKVGKVRKKAWRERRTLEKRCPTCHRRYPYQWRKEYVCLNCGYHGGRRNGI